MVEYELSTLITMVSQVASALGICIAAAYYILNMRTTLQTRQAQLFMGVYQTWATRDSQRQLKKVLTFNFKDYDEWVSKYWPVGDTQRIIRAGTM